MPTSFFATQFPVLQQDEVLITTLGAPSTEEDDYYLMLQLGLAHTKQDLKLGMDKPYLEFCGQGWSWYGEIELFLQHPVRHSRRWLRLLWPERPLSSGALLRSWRSSL